MCKDYLTYLTVPNPSQTIISNTLERALLAADTPSAIQISPAAGEKRKGETKDGKK